MFTIPRQADAHHEHMAQVDKGDLNILQQGILGRGVMYGCEVTAQGTPDMTVAVAAGAVLTSNQRTYEVSAGNVGVSAADGTEPRIDIVVATATGSKDVRTGTPGLEPIQPTLTAGDVALALVYVEAEETAIESTMIADKRVTPPGYVYVKKTVTETLTESDVLQDDDELKFWLGPNETWIVRAHMVTTADGTSADYRWGCSVPAGADVDMAVIATDTGDAEGLNSDAYWSASISGAPNIEAGGSTTSNNAEALLLVTIENGATAGYANLKWAQRLLGTDTIRVEAGSFLEAWKI